MPCERGRGRRGQTCYVRTGPLHRSICTQLPEGSWGAPYHLLAGDSEMSYRYHMGEHAGGRTKGRCFIRSNILIAVNTLPKGQQFAFTSAQPSVSMGTQHLPATQGGYFPYPLGYHTSTLSKSSLLGCRYQDEPGCASHEKTSHNPQSHCVRHLYWTQCMEWLCFHDITSHRALPPAPQREGAMHAPKTDTFKCTHLLSSCFGYCSP